MDESESIAGSSGHASKVTKYQDKSNSPLIWARRTLAELQVQLEIREAALKEAKEKIVEQLSKLQREEIVLEERIRVLSEQQQQQQQPSDGHPMNF